uniref:Uncharacterized protein n=1 Tax=Caenorhabditis japonica TaxID=281687 RepID=A0A8R1EU10_CAEJA
MRCECAWTSVVNEGRRRGKMPKGGATSLTPVFAGLREDLDTFLRAFLKLKSHRFSDYKTLFEHRGIISLFNGRSSSAEIVEFHESLLVHCLPYLEEFVCAGTKRSVQERLFGIFSLYTFFYLQSANHVVKIRLDPDSARCFLKLVTFLENEQIYDALLCVKKLQMDRAFKIVAYIPLYDPTFYKQFNTDKNPIDVQVLANVNDPLGQVKAMIESPVFTKLSVAHRAYTKLKKQVGFHGYGISGIVDLQKSAREIVAVKMKDEGRKESAGSRLFCVSSGNNRAPTRLEIKEKAYSADLNVTRFRRHRTVETIKILPEVFTFKKEFAEFDGEEDRKFENEKEREKDEDVIRIKDVHKKIKQRPVIRRENSLTEEKQSGNKKVPTKKPKLEPISYSSGTSVKSGRRTNNSISSELFTVKVEYQKEEPEDVEMISDAVQVETIPKKHVSFLEDSKGNIAPIIRRITPMVHSEESSGEEVEEVEQIVESEEEKEATRKVKVDNLRAEYAEIPEIVGK